MSNTPGEKGIKIFGIIVLVLIAIFLILSVIVSNGIPFIEGPDRVVEGEAYHFSIGMTKQSAFEVIKKHYSKDEYYLRVLWLRKSELDKELQQF